MNRIKDGLKAISSLFFYSSLACASTSDIPLKHEALQSEAMHGKSDSKGFTAREPGDFVSVLTSDDLSGDIVILRWNGERSQFKAEIYQQEDKPGRRSWLFRGGDKSKTLNQKPNGEFFISEIAETGQKIEVFRLSAPPNPPTP